MTQNYTEKTRDLLAQMSPLGHIAEADEIADVGCFLISNESRIVNGASSFG